MIEYSSAMLRMQFLQMAIANLEIVVAARGDMDGNLGELTYKLALLKDELLSHNWLGDAHSQMGQKMAKSFGTVIVGRRVELNGGPSGSLSKDGKFDNRERAIVVAGRKTKKSHKTVKVIKTKRVKPARERTFNAEAETNRINHLNSITEFVPNFERGLYEQARKEVRAEQARNRHAKRFTRGSFGTRIVARAWAAANGGLRLSKGQCARLGALLASEVA